VGVEHVQRIGVIGPDELGSVVEPYHEGGVGTVLGAIIGGLVLGVLNNGMNLVGIGTDYQQVIKGFVLLAAVGFDVWNKRKVGS